MFQSGILSFQTGTLTEFDSKNYTQNLGLIGEYKLWRNFFFSFETKKLRNVPDWNVSITDLNHSVPYWNINVPTLVLNIATVCGCAGPGCMTSEQGPWCMMTWGRPTIVVDTTSPPTSDWWPEMTWEICQQWDVSITRHTAIISHYGVYKAQHQINIKSDGGITWNKLDLVVTMAVTIEGLSFLCPSCDKGFKSRENFRQHI